MQLQEYRNSKKQGDAGLGVAISWFCVNGYDVYLPLTDSQDCDLIVENGEGLQKVQIRTTTYRQPSGSYAVELRTSGGNKSWNKVVKTVKDTDVDILFVVTKDGDRYLIPTSEFQNRSSITFGEEYERYRL